MQSSNYRAPRRRDNELRSLQRERREIQYSPEERQRQEQRFANRNENEYQDNESDQNFYDYERNREHLRYASPDFNTGYGHDANRPLPRDFVSHSDYESEKRMKEMNNQDWTERDFHPEQHQKRRDDKTLQAEISHVLAQHRGIDARDIDVQVTDGIVTLTGFVPERRMRYIAEDISIDCYGVIDVTNQLIVSRTSEAEARFGGRRTFDRRP
ncbi:BON domain-containing protein [Bdellovibrio sp. HCB185ZH]|uniref:BON domain-containing protein n=1 Tax=Bdellovibrio sp. HCB185ZH TaxID=3394235 RepID=UPI0039A4F737